jgi:hypothetical protein
MEEMNVQDMSETDEIVQQMLDSITPKERLVGLTPQERLTGLAPEQQVLALSDGVLRGLSQEYLSTLPTDIQETIRRRLGPKGTP